MEACCSYLHDTVSFAAQFRFPPLLEPYSAVFAHGTGFCELIRRRVV